LNEQRLVWYAHRKYKVCKELLLESHNSGIKIYKTKSQLDSGMAMTKTVMNAAYTQYADGIVYEISLDSISGIVYVPTLTGASRDVAKIENTAIGLSTQLYHNGSQLPESSLFLWTTKTRNTF
jgi:hypothetical protein